MTTSTIPAAPVTNKSAEDLTALHDYLLKIAQSDAPYPNPIGDAKSLISFNGYYALNSSGAFLTIDTNLVVKNGTATPHVALIYSADGSSSNVYHLTGPDSDFSSFSWNEDTLVTVPKTGSNAPALNITFTRENNSNGVTSSLKGSLSYPPSEVIVELNGNTYNNPIPMDMYAGTYYEDKGQGAEIMIIGTDNTLQYNYTNIGGSGGSLQDVDCFIYNLNMYVFSFSALDGTFNYSIIMGTSAEGGMVCNDMFSLKNTQISIPRSLQTIKTSVTEPASGTNSASENMAAFAGFYRLSSGTNAFLSVEGQYKTISDGTMDYTVTMGVSEDGVNSNVYTLDSTMTFEQSGDSWVLTMPKTASRENDLSVTFTRTYKSINNVEGSYYGSVVRITGSYNGSAFTGATLLNVVPLMGFAGAPLKVKTSSTETIVIKSNSEIEYHGESYKNLTVVPLMYIVGFMDQAGDEVILSLGTDGGKGNTCITTVSTIKEVNGKTEKSLKSIEVYTAIPDGDSAAPSH